MTKEEFNLIESKLLLPYPIFFDNYKIKKKETLKSFFENFYNIEKDNNTINSEGAIITHSDNFARSFREIFNICKYYFPNITLEDFIRAIYSPDLVGHCCGDIMEFCIANTFDYNKDGWGLDNTTDRLYIFNNHTFNNLLTYLKLK